MRLGALVAVFVVIAAISAGGADDSRELRPYAPAESRCSFATVGGRKPVTTTYERGEGDRRATIRVYCFDQPHCRCQVRAFDLPATARGMSLIEIVNAYGHASWSEVGKVKSNGAVKTESHEGEEFTVVGLPDVPRPAGDVDPQHFLRCRVFVDRNRAFIVSGSAPGRMKREADLEAKAFFDSFRIAEK